MTRPAVQEPLVRLSDANLGYQGTPVLSGVSLDLPRGLHVIVGPNGSGKTTLLRAVAGVLPPLSGQVEYAGGGRPRIGYLGHRSSLYPGLTVLGNLRYWARVAGLDPTAVERAVRALDLAAIAERRVSRLSRGQRQRAALARALLGDPELLLLDEPTTGLDPETVAATHEHVRRLAQRSCLVLSSHSLAEVAELADDILLIDQGTVRRRSVTEALAASAGSRRVRLGVTGDLERAMRVLAARAPVEVDGPWLVVSITRDVSLGDCIALLQEHGFEVATVQDLEALRSLYGRKDPAP